MMSTATTATSFSTATHNGIVTMRNLATGNHRTISIRTQSKRSKFAPGQRVIALKTADGWKRFGFVGCDGRVHVWRKQREQPERFEALARMVEQPERFEAQAGIEYQFSGRCRRCNRRLTDPESIRSGIGPVCAGRE